MVICQITNPPQFIHSLRLIENVDRKFSQFCINSNNEGCPCEAADCLQMDDFEVAQLKAEYDRLQRETALSDLEKRRTEFFEVLPIKTCSSDQFLNVRNERLATTLHDIELLFVVDSDNDSVCSETSCNHGMSFAHTNNSSSFTTDEHMFQHSCQSFPSLVFKIKKFFKCW